MNTAVRAVRPPVDIGRALECLVPQSSYEVSIFDLLFEGRVVELLDFKLRSQFLAQKFGYVRPGNAAAADADIVCNGGRILRHM